MTDEEDKTSLRIDVAVLKEKVKLLSYVIKNNLVTKHQFEVVKAIAYGLAAVVLVSVLGAILKRTF